MNCISLSHCLLFTVIIIAIRITRYLNIFTAHPCKKSLTYPFSHRLTNEKEGVMLHRLVVCLLALGITLVAFALTGTEVDAKRITQGSLQVIDKDGNFRSICPLKHTNVDASISGSISRVTVTQEFTNPFKETIEAIYVFPLPNLAAVDDMTIAIGERKVKGLIKKREEARAIYEAARDRGMIAALLDQERPNIFTQSVANIVPGASIKVEISYVEQLKFEDGTYEFVFPMVVGPRYIPKAKRGTSIGS